MQMLSTTERRMFSYQELVDTWQKDRANAKAVDRLSRLLQRIDFAGLLREGMLLWETITELHQGFLDSVTSGEIEPNLGLEQKIWHLYKDWLSLTVQLKAVLQEFDELDVKVEHADAFLRCLDDALEQLSGIEEPQVAIRSFVAFTSQSCH